MTSHQEWILSETKNAKLGDRRLEKRLSKVLELLSSTSDNSVPVACKSWKETIAAYRFFNHEKVTPEEILSSHKESTLERIKKEKLALIVQDTTDVDFSNRKSIDGMGFLSTEKSQGLYLHPSIAITPKKLCLGVVGTQIWSRKILGVKKDRKNKPIEEKESYRWLKGFNIANEISKNCPETLIISISDREGDIYEALEKCHSKSTKAFWLIRSSINRKILKHANSEISKMHDFIKTKAPIGKIVFELPEGKIYERSIIKPRKARRKRQVTQQIKIANITLCPPKRKNKNLSPANINVIYCEEINPPSKEEKIEWCLITSFPVADLNIAKQVICWYLCRWQIEVFFKVLKSGCAIEKLQLKTMAAIANCISLYLIISWRILYITMVARIYPTIKCDRIFEDHEWQSVYVFLKKTSPPKNTPLLEDIISIVAQLGGFLNRKSDQYPGAKSMWIGLQKMKDLTNAWRIFNSVSNKTYVYGYDINEGVLRLVG